MASWNAIGLFCEDVREEKQTYSIVGILPDNMHLSSVPSAIPKLGIYLRTHIDVSTNVESISAKLRYPDGSEQALSEFDPTLIRDTLNHSRATGAPIAAFIISGVASPMPITMAGRILIIVQVDKDEMVCGSLNIQVPTTVSSNVSAQLS